MGKYIDADKLIAEIERREKIHFNDYHIKKNGNPADYGACNALCQLRSFINSLQQERTDVDLEKDIEKVCDFNKAQTTITLTKGALRAAAYHFYELGLKAGKEEEL